MFIPKKIKSFLFALIFTVSGAFYSDLFYSDAFAQVQTESVPPPPSAPGFAEVLSKMSPMLIMVFFIFYFMVVKPQNKKLVEQQKLVDELKKGDSVVTNSGIHGKVFGIEADHIMLEIAQGISQGSPQGIKVKFEKNSILKKI